MKRMYSILALSLLLSIIIAIIYVVNKAQNTKEFCNAVRHSDINGMESMLRKGVDINKQFGRTGSTALHNAVYNNDAKTTLFLLENGANPNIRTKKGIIPLTYSIHNGNYEITKLLLDHGVSPNEYVTGGISTIHRAGWCPALHAAIQAKHYQIVELLLSKGANPNVKFHGKTPLHLAIKLKEAKIAKLLEKQEQANSP